MYYQILLKIITYVFWKILKMEKGFYNKICKLITDVCSYNLKQNLI